MSMSGNKYTFAVLGLLSLLVGAGAFAAPVAACNCSAITFSTSSSSGSPIIVTSIMTTFGPSGNTISLHRLRDLNWRVHVRECHRGNCRVDCHGDKCKYISHHIFDPDYSGTIRYWCFLRRSRKLPVYYSRHSSLDTNHIRSVYRQWRTVNHRHDLHSLVEEVRVLRRSI